MSELQGYFLTNIGIEIILPMSNVAETNFPTNRFGTGPRGDIKNDTLVVSFFMLANALKRTAGSLAPRGSHCRKKS